MQNVRLQGLGVIVWDMCQEMVDPAAGIQGSTSLRPPVTGGKLEKLCFILSARNHQSSSFFLHQHQGDDIQNRLAEAELKICYLYCKGLCTKMTYDFALFDVFLAV